MICLIVAVAENGVIGANGKLPWDLPSDLKRFKRLTMGHALVMGRKTFESIGRPLPGRRTIVVSGKMKPREGVAVVASLTEALASARGQTFVDPCDVFIAGGAQLYAEALEADVVDRVYWTWVNRVVLGDAHFPVSSLVKDGWQRHWEIVAEERSVTDPCTFITYDRRR